MMTGISFDYDHTLYDRDKTYENLVDDFRAYFAGYLHNGLSRERLLRTMQDCDRSGIYKADHWEGIYRDTLASGIFERAPTYELYYDGFIKGHYPQAIVLYGDTIPTLDELKRRGYKVSILTNGPSNYQRDKIRRVHLDERVDALAVGGELEYAKPNACAFNHICREMGCKPEETVYVGDNPYNDVEGARRAGLIPVWMRSVGYWPEDLPFPRYCIDNLSELPDLMARIANDRFLNEEHP